jgi:RHS repeat-associated protein
MTDEASNKTTYTYGAADRLAEAARVNATTPVDDWLYTYDPAGNRTLRRHAVGTGSPVNTSFGYNAANELCYSVTGTPTGSCAAPPTGATTYTYDADGQRTTGPTAAYDVQQRLTTLSGTALSYLSPGNRELTGYGTTTLQNNLLGLSRIMPSSGTATDLIRAPSGGTLAQRVGATSKQELFTDALGSTIATADDGATTLSRSYDYDPDGNATASGSGTDAVVRYAGGYPVGGLYHYGARYYDPATAAWTQQDPLDQTSSLTQANHYTYAGGDPIDGADSTGTCFHQPKSDPFPNVCKSPFYTTHPADDEDEGPCGAKNGSLVAGDCPGPDEGEDSDSYILPEFRDTPAPGWDPVPAGPPDLLPVG